MKRSFMQNIEDLLKNEVEFALEKNRSSRSAFRKDNRHTVQQSDLIGSVSSTPPKGSLENTPNLGRQKTGDNKPMAKYNQIGAQPGQRWFTKTRLNETMTRELISWLGLLSTEKHGLKLLTKFKIFDYLQKLMDADGYYDHLILLMLNTFIFHVGFDDSPKEMLRVWCKVSSPLLSKNILEYFRMLYRAEFYSHHWFMPLILNFAFDKDRSVSQVAFDVLEESCQD